MSHREEFVDWVTWTRCRDCALFKTGTTHTHAIDHARTTGHRVRWMETRTSEYSWVGDPVPVDG